MSTTTTTTTTTICPCDTPVVPQLVIPAGLDALPRQLRAFPEVRRALLEALPTKTALQQWRARNSQDLGIMLLEMWAYVSDVLNFYDERIANESYVRTAQRRTSLRRLVELIGYIPAPGIAGTVTLAALAEGRNIVTLPAGTGFRSDAFAGNPPQVFEISTDTDIHPLKNEWTIGPQPDHDPLQPTPTELASGSVDPADARRFLVFDPATLNLAVGQPALLNVFGRGVSPEARVVVAINKFGGRDGQSYVEVQFDTGVNWATIEDVSQVLVQRPTRTLKPTLQESNPINSTNDGISIKVDGASPQVSIGDQVIIRVGSADGSTTHTAGQVSGIDKSTVVLVKGDPNAKPTAIPDVTAPATVISITIVDSFDVTKISNPQQLSLLAGMVIGGHVVTVNKIELAQADIEGQTVAFNGIIARPPDAQPDPILQGTFDLTNSFLLTDVNKHGAALTGTVRFDASGHAQLLTDTNSLDPNTGTFNTPITVFGNLLFATRGETVNNEVLGNGDPRSSGQTFKLKKKPLTYLSPNNDLSFVSTLKVFVDNVQWTEVKSFLDCGPQSRSFIVRHDDNQESFIIFGDGVHGARLPSGVNNVVATYRFGSGKAAPPAGAIQQVARPVIGLRAVRAPIPASEGRDPEGPDQLRSAGPSSVQLFDRVVSTRDFQTIASQQQGVVQVTSQFAWIPSQRQAGVIVRFIGTPSQPKLEKALRDRAEPNIALDVHKASPLAATLTVTIEVDPSFKPDVVSAAVLAALTDPATGPLSQAQAPIGGQLLVSPLFELIQAQAGVVAVTSVALTRADQSSPSPINLGAEALECAPTDSFFDFTADGAVTVNVADQVTGAVSATLPGGC
jgi:predicted phage baseplate assembly protein